MNMSHQESGKETANRFSHRSNQMPLKYLSQMVVWKQAFDFGLALKEIHLHSCSIFM